MKFIHQFLNRFGLCQHDLKFEGTETKKHISSGTWVTMKLWKCTKCGEEVKQFVFKKDNK